MLRWLLVAIGPVLVSALFSVVTLVWLAWPLWLVMVVNVPIVAVTVWHLDTAVGRRLE